MQLFSECPSHCSAFSLGCLFKVVAIYFITCLFTDRRPSTAISVVRKEFKDNKDIHTIRSWQSLPHHDFQFRHLSMHPRFVGCKVPSMHTCNPFNSIKCYTEPNTKIRRKRRTPKLVECKSQIIILQSPDRLLPVADPFPVTNVERLLLSETCNYVFRESNRDNLEISLIIPGL